MKQRQKISDNAAQFIKSIERRQSISREELFSLIENNEINEETRSELSTIVSNIPIRNNKPVKLLNNLRKESLKKRGALKSKRISDAAVHYIEKSESCQSLSKDDFLKKMRDDFKITDETCKYVEENVREEMSEIENQTGRTAQRTRRVCSIMQGRNQGENLVSGDMVKVSENLGATAVAPVAPVDTSLLSGTLLKGYLLMTKTFCSPTLEYPIKAF